jgi:hypothetical protein
MTEVKAVVTIYIQTEKQQQYIPWMYELIQRPFNKTKM